MNTPPAMTAEQIAKLRELEAKATKGPLKVSNYRPNNVIARDPKESTYTTGDNEFRSVAIFDQVSDASLFAFLRNNAIPLCNALEAAQKENAELRKFRDAAVAYIEARDELDMIDRDSRNYQPARAQARKAWIAYKSALARVAELKGGAL